MMLEIPEHKFQNRIETPGTEQLVDSCIDWRSNPFENLFIIVPHLESQQTMS